MSFWPSASGNIGNGSTRSTTRTSRIWRLLRVLTALTFTSAGAFAALADNALITWTPPTTYTDGTTLRDLAGYRLYSGCVSSGQYERPILTLGLVSSYDLGGLPSAGTCYFSLISFTSAGIDSVRSNEASKFMGAMVAPGNPTLGPTINWAKSQAVPPMTISASAGPISFQDGGGTSASTTIAVNAGEFVLVGCVWKQSSGANLSSITLTSESNATLQTTFAGSSLNHSYAFGLFGAAGSTATKTVQVNWDATVGAGACFVVSLATNSGNAITVDDYQQNAGNSATASVSTTASASGDAAFAIGGSDASELTQDTGYTSIGLANVWNIATGEYNVAIGGSGSKTVQMTATSGHWEILAILLKDAAGGGDVLMPQALLW